MNENKPVNPEETVPEEITPEETVLEEVTPEEAAPEEVTPEEAAPEEAVLEEAAAEGNGAEVPQEGAAVGTQDAPAAKSAAEMFKGKRKPLTVAAAVVVAVAVIAISASAVISNQPLGILAKGAKNSYEALKNNEIVVLGADIMKGGSIEASVDLEPLTESMMGYGIEGNASVKLYSSDKPAAAAVGSVEIDGENLLDLTLTMNREEIAVNSTSLLGGNAYGLCLDSIEKYFDSSAFGPDGDYSLGVEFAEIEETLSSVKDRSSSSEEAAKIAEDLLKTALKSVTTHAEIEKGSEILSFAGEECKTTAVSVQADMPAMLNIAGDVIDYCRTDSDLREFLTENSDLLVSAAEYGSYYAMDAEEMLDAFYKALEMAAEEIEQLKERAEHIDTEVEITFYVTKSGSYLVGAELDLEFYEESVKMEAFIGPNPKNVTEISFRFDDGYEKIRGSYTVKTNDAKEYSAALRIKDDGETVFSGSVDWDKKDGDLDIEFVDEWEDTYALSCELEHSSKATVIRVISYEDDDQELDIGVTVTLKGSDKMPTISRYTDILTMDEDEIEDIIYDIMDIASELSNFMY